MGRLRERLVSAGVRGLQDFGDVVFAGSQVGVPVDRGTLKKSGTFKKLPDGFEITYRTPYAARLHYGMRAHDERVRRHYVRAHTRRVGAPKVVFIRRVSKRWPAGHYAQRYRHTGVRAHYRGPYTRHVKEQRARPWLQDALDRNAPRLGQYIGRALAREFGHR